MSEVNYFFKKTFKFIVENKMDEVITANKIVNVQGVLLA